MNRYIKEMLDILDKKYQDVEKTELMRLAEFEAEYNLITITETALAHKVVVYSYDSGVETTLFIMDDEVTIKNYDVENVGVFNMILNEYFNNIGLFEN